MSEQIERIEKLAAERNMKMAEFKRKIGITAQQYNHWKNRGVPMDYMITIAELFSVDVNWLATGQIAKSKEAESALAILKEENVNLSSVKIGLLAELFGLVKMDVDLDDVNMLKRMILNTKSKYTHDNNHAHA
jgi:hypothetical protein